MNDIVNESPEPMHAAARRHPAFRHLSGKTLTRYALRGVLRDGKRLKLETLRVGGRLLTSQAALGRFLAAQNSAPAPVFVPRSPTTRQRESERAAAELDRKLASV